jgi:flagellar motor protein MotB
MADEQPKNEHGHKSNHNGKGHGNGHGGHEEGHEGAPEWLISFADNVTLMMGFFVVLLAFNMGPKGGGETQAKQDGGGAAANGPTGFLDAAVSIRDAFNNPVNLNSMDPNDQVLIRHIIERRGLGQADQIGPEGDQHNVQSIRPSKYFKLCGKVLFDENSSALNEAGRLSVLSIVNHIRGYRLTIDVRGHASAVEAFNTPDHGTRLSFDRAVTVADFFQKNGVDRKCLRLIVCGDNERINDPTYDGKDHAPNQRVEVVITEQVAGDDETPDSRPSTTTQPARVDSHRDSANHGS